MSTCISEFKGPCTTLCEACRIECTACVERIIREDKESVNREESRTEWPLRCALNTQNVHIIKMLVDNGVEVGRGFLPQYMLIHIASMDNVKLASLVFPLFKHRFSDISPPLTHMAMHSLPMLRLILHYDERQLDECTYYGGTLMHCAARNNKTAELEAVHAMGSTSIDKRYRTPEATFTPAQYTPFGHALRTLARLGSRSYHLKRGTIERTDAKYISTQVALTTLSPIWVFLTLDIATDENRSKWRRHAHFLETCADRLYTLVKLGERWQEQGKISRQRRHFTN